MKRHATRVGWGAVVGVLLAATPVLAQSEDPGSESTEAGTVSQDPKPSESAAEDEASMRELAARHFERGVAAYRAGRYGEALDAFLEAYRVHPSPTFLFNAARAHDRLGNVVQALHYYRAYLRAAPEAGDREPVTRRVRELEALLQKRGVQQVSLLTKPEGATLWVDGQPVGVTPWIGQLVPGQHRWELRLEGYETRRGAFALTPHRSLDVFAELAPLSPGEPSEPSPEQVAPEPPPTPPAPSESTPTPEEPPRARSFPRPVSLVVFGAGALTTGVAVLLETSRQNTAVEIRSTPVQLDRYEALDRYDRQTQAVRIVTATGIGVMVAGAVLAVRDVTPRKKSVGWACTPDQCALWARGTF